MSGVIALEFYLTQLGFVSLYPLRYAFDDHVCLCAELTLFYHVAIYTRTILYLERELIFCDDLVVWLFQALQQTIFHLCLAMLKGDFMYKLSFEQVACDARPCLMTTFVANDSSRVFARIIGCVLCCVSCNNSIGKMPHAVCP